MLEEGLSLLVIFFAVVGFAFYFLPTIVVFIRRKTNRLPVFLLNLFLGWTFIGWVIALVWAATSEKS